MRLGKKPHYSVVVEGGLNARYYDFFWAYHKMNFISESELIRDSWRTKWETFSEKEKNEIKQFLERNPSPRMERVNKLKCE